MEQAVSHRPTRVAIIGGGISAIACAWSLREVDWVVDIHEAEDRLGGHANSVQFRGNGNCVTVDTGFIAMNESSYPQFSRFLDDLGVETIPTDMSFSVSTNEGFEWGSYSVKSFVGELSNLLKPWFWRLLLDILRFTLFARSMLSESAKFDEKLASSASQRAEQKQWITSIKSRHFESIGHFLERKKYSAPFIKLYFLPMVAAPWCTAPDEFAQSFPARPLLSFMKQHGLLDTMYRKLQWRSFRGGSISYVNRFQETLPSNHHLHLNHPVQRIAQRSNEGVLVEFGDGTSSLYDHVVLAVHANQALRILGTAATPMEETLLRSFQTSRNVCYLHSDTSLLPRRQSARSAWNCLLGSKGDLEEKSCLARSGESKPRISVTFDMNKLQAIPEPHLPHSPGRVLVTMNPAGRPKASQSVHVYDHPLITSESILASTRLQKINGVLGVSFAGAWMGWGFHEDGFVAGKHAAISLLKGHENVPPLQLFNLDISDHT